MLKLYGGARSRATIIQWQLEELVIPYEFVMLDMQARGHRQEVFLAINPFGKVPAIVDGEYLNYIPMLLKLNLSEYTEISKYMQRMQERYYPIFSSFYSSDIC